MDTGDAGGGDEDETDWTGHAPIVPDDFEVPKGLRTDLFVLEPLGPGHNAEDLEAWASSMDHIRATPGFAGRSWPSGPATLERNEADLTAHAADFAARVGFTWTVLDPSTRQVIGCVYMYPPKSAAFDVDVRSWVRADRADLDTPLYEAVRGWIASSWPFTTPDYAPRPAAT